MHYIYKKGKQGLYQKGWLEKQTGESQLGKQDERNDKKFCSNTILPSFEG